MGPHELAGDKMRSYRPTDPNFTGPFFIKMESADRQHVNPLQRVDFEAALWCCRHCSALVMERAAHATCSRAGCE